MSPIEKLIALLEDLGAPLWKRAANIHTSQWERYVPGVSGIAIDAIRRDFVTWLQSPHQLSFPNLDAAWAYWIQKVTDQKAPWVKGALKSLYQRDPKMAPSRQAPERGRTYVY